MAIPWDSILSIAFIIGPIALGKAVTSYRSARNVSRPPKSAVRPVPLRIWPALGLLFLVAAFYLVQTLPALAPENIFVRTQSRLLTPADVLFNRLASLRPDHALTPHDEALRARLVNIETLVTASTWTDVHGSQWRTIATLAAAFLAAADVFMVKTYDYKSNTASLRLEDIDFFFWSMRSYRLFALAAFDALLGYLIYLSCTNRAFATPISAPERVDALARGLLSVKSKMSAMGIVRNTALRDTDLRSRSQAYWIHEVRLMSEVMEERDVVEGVNDALSSRIDMQAVLRDADAYSQAVLQPLQNLAPDDAS
ncbi:hypothetical protein XA68_16273 [Ophiocordyceps unilateralis]|uniref:Uncharacterized protein n=1 Tax=Ophiocordyceps unilateralis TaxID=268505 RepID=A0A2A9P6H7_OPHUN|nr:hypothetical protein XA68_16273 [Ophiocordyceps unilateralis]